MAILVVDLLEVIQIADNERKGAFITKKPPVVTASEVRIGKMMEWYDCSKAVNELGLPQTPIHMTIKKALNWFRENGYLTKIAK